MTSDEATNLRPLKRLARPFMAGTLALFPLALTLGVILWMGSLIRTFLGPHSGFGQVLRRVGLAFVASDIVAYLIGLAAAVGLIYLLGLLVEAGMRKRWQALTDRLLARVPLVGTVYDAAKKLTHMVEPDKDSDLRAMTPVLCRFGGDGGSVFPAFMPTSKVLRIDGRAYHTVMIPTAPLPFGGALMCVPAEQVTPMNCGIDGLLNLYMTMGVTAPDYLGDKSKADTETQPTP